MSAVTGAASSCWHLPLTSSSSEELAGRFCAAVAGALADAAVGCTSSGILTGRPSAAAVNSRMGGDLYKAS